MAITRKQVRRGFLTLTGIGTATKFPIGAKVATGSGLLRFSGTGTALRTGVTASAPVWSGLQTQMVLPQGNSIGLAGYCTGQSALTFTSVGTALPSGVTLSSNGVLSAAIGAPVTSTAGIIFRATDTSALATNSQTLTLRVGVIVWQTSVVLGKFYQGSPRDIQLVPTYVSHLQSLPMTLSFSGTPPAGIGLTGSVLSWDGVGDGTWDIRSIQIDATDGVSALSLVDTVQMPLDGATQIKFGRGIAGTWDSQRRKILYTGGEVQQSGHTLTEGVGSNTLWSYDASTKTMAKVLDYYEPSGSQPKFPSYYGWMNDVPDGFTMALVPGSNTGTWVGAATPITNFAKLPYGTNNWSAGLFQDFQGGNWVDIAPSSVGWPAKYRSWQANKAQSNAHALAVVNVAGQIRLLKWRTNGQYTGFNVISTGLTAMDFSDFPQVFIDWENNGELFCYDWISGWIVAVDLDSTTGGQQKSRKVVQLQPLSAKTDQFVMVGDSFKRTLIVVLGGQMKVIDLSQRGYETVSDGPALPSGVTGFDSAVLDLNADTIVFTGTSAGTDSLYHYKLPPKLSPIALPQGKWRDWQMNGSQSNVQGHIRWTNPGGDWLDLADTPQGTQAHVTAPLNGVGTVTITGAALAAYVNLQISRGNPGMLMTGGFGSSAFATRVNTDTTKRPKLTVITASGTYLCPCTDFTILSVQAGNDTHIDFDLQTLPNDFPLVMNFDTSAVQGTALSTSSLQITCTTHNNNPKTISFFQLKLPLLGEAGETPVPIASSGLAASYPDDIGITSNPSVLMAADFSGSPDWTVKFPGAGSAYFTGLYGVQYEPQLKSTAALARFNYHLIGPVCNQIIKFENYSQPDVDEAYFRTAVLFENNFGSRVQGGKNGYGFDLRFPGTDVGNGGSPANGMAMYKNVTLSTSYTVNVGAQTITIGRDMPIGSRARFCFLVPGGITEGVDYYVAQKPMTNTYVFASDAGLTNIVTLTSVQPVLSNSTAVGYIAWNVPAVPEIEYEGGSCRTSQYASQAGNAIENYVRFTGYMYCAEPGEGGYGTGVPLDASGRNWVVKKNQWYSIEARLKLNTLSGTPDHLGNQMANADGIYQLWMHKVGDPGNATLVASRTDMLWRYHSNVKIKGAWNDWVHGGQKRTQAEHGFRMSNFVVATQYIGPLRVSP